MTFSEWRQLSPGAAAREIHARVSRFTPAQRRAIIAHLPDENELATQFAAAPRDQPLSGVPVFVKDLFDAAGTPTFAGSTFLPEARLAARGESAFVRAIRAAGGVLVGKTQMHEFAYGITGENPHYGDCEHPRFPGRTTGGSSSGSAAVVAADIAPLALGSDTGGSIRLPAAFCGLFGFRLSPRDEWIRDAFPLAPTFDTAGWFTANAEDMRASLRALIGLTSSERDPRGCSLELPGLDPEIAQAFQSFAACYAAPAEASVRESLLAGFSRGVETYNTIVAQEAWQAHRSWADRYRDRYDPAVWQRLTRVHSLTPSQIDAAHADLAAVRQLWTTFFLTYDFLLLPAAPKPALTKAECTLENRTRILALTTPASLGGLPVLTIPITLPSGLSTGLQLIVNDRRSPVIDWALSLSTSPS